MAAEGPSVRAYTPVLRTALALLQGTALLNLLELATRMALDALVAGESARAPLALVVRRTVLLSVLPWLLFLIGRALAAATISVSESTVVIRAGWGTVEIPRAAIVSVRRWRLPLPEPGFTLVLRSGSVGLSWTAAGVLGAPEFPDARARYRVRALHHPLIKLGLVPAALTFILFRLHQRIAFGDLFGEARMLGWRRWLRTLTGVALSSFCALLIAAAVLRIAVEVIALITARLRPHAAARARLGLEVAAAAVYYGGLLAVLLSRLGL